MEELVIALPTYGGVAPEHLTALLRLQEWLAARGVRARALHQDLTEISRARNKLATHFLEATAARRLLFIDSDIEFAPEAVGALLDAGKPLVGAVYPKRHLDIDRLIAAARRIEDPKQALASALEFVVQPLGEAAEVVDGLCRVAGVGMGLCLIERGVFEALAATGRIRAEAGATGFFDPLTTADGILSEDLAFCHRWRTLCGGEVWALVDHEIGHVGTLKLKARLLDAFLAGQAPG
jgi:hypothetical protein